ncbi:hypothetical protein M011DRAFT_468599 [Sporormia fimetaria CBS 119925]|uniref:DDHD domain-containing protein n=1 Tax=Sporormia fimetaria CBS 119925 TaxID=1340428 RepID=A0A6A6V9C4_9PLEO|nr:hypothetical protein M011DRAFT_468599 [Sporormia fimetaria CBS 119925]
MAQHTNQYLREVLHSQEPPPTIPVRYFYTSPLAIDDPLSPLPPPATGASTRRHPPRPFSEYDNKAIDSTWLGLRKEILRHAEEVGEKQSNTGALSHPLNPSVARLKRKRGDSGSRDPSSSATPGRDIPSRRSSSGGRYSRSAESSRRDRSSSAARQLSNLSTSLRTSDLTDQLSTSGPDTTGNPFIRAPSRGNLKQIWEPSSEDSSRRPAAQEVDSYKWDTDMDAAVTGGEDAGRPKNKPQSGPSAKVPVGVSRLHHVAMDAESFRLEPIYWSPVNDIAQVVRGTWFYKDTMLPVEIDVANMLEVGYLDLQPWSQTWADELTSAIEVGAVGEMKILHKLWPQKPKKPESRPVSSAQMQAGFVQNTLAETESDPEEERRRTVEAACDLIDLSTGSDGPDHKALGDPDYSHNGHKNLYRSAGVIYADAKDAYLLRPSLQPSDYYGRRPLANFIRKGRPIGIRVTRGFDQEIWDKLHPRKKTQTAKLARQGVSTSQAGVSPQARKSADPDLALSERPEVTDLVLVIHGIGQKLSERIETFHFTHAINAFRREVNVELGVPDVKKHLRPDAGGIMVLPVNWRQRVRLEDAGGEAEEDDVLSSAYTLKDITPDTLPAVRGIVSDVMLDIPYYLSPTHNQRMVTACIKEANRIYRLWCLNNPHFATHGRVHLIAHSLGSVMAIDILSQQPTLVPAHIPDPSTPESSLPTDHFIFNTTSLFVCGSPVGFFLLLKKATLLPRRDKEKPGAGSYAAPGVSGDQGTYGCIPVDNVYNIINPYDPVAYRLNAAVDVAYAEMLKPAIIPSATSSSWLAFANPFRSGHDDNNTAATHTTAPDDAARRSVTRLPSNVELETHDFTREEIAEKRAYLLNDNGQIDYCLKYGGGPLEIQYLTMLGAHSSYWLSRDFVRMIVVEVGRKEGREGTVARMRAGKRKVVVS